VNPPGNETLGGGNYLKAVLDKEGIDSEIVEFAPNRGSLIARLKGAGKAPPICLLSPIDVVPAEANHWPKDRQPFLGCDRRGRD